MKKLFVLLPLLLTACAVTGPAEDKWDEEEKEDKINLSGILGKSSSKKAAEAKAENEALRARIERLENSQKTGNTAVAPSATSGTSSNTGRADNSSVSFREWSSARQQGSAEYDEFKEYQKWLEFKKFKEQAQQQAPQKQ